MSHVVMPERLVCPAPVSRHDRVQLGHGSGGKMSAALLRERFLPHFNNPALGALGDGAVVPMVSGRVVVSTDTFVVSPLEFPGGNIGSLAVHGTLNDLAESTGGALIATAVLLLQWAGRQKKEDLPAV